MAPVQARIGKAAALFFKTRNVDAQIFKESSAPFGQCESVGAVTQQASLQETSKDRYRQFARMVVITGPRKDQLGRNALGNAWGGRLLRDSQQRLQRGRYRRPLKSVELVPA
jgi:hypothetical protein